MATVETSSVCLARTPCPTGRPLTASFAARVLSSETTMLISTTSWEPDHDTGVPTALAEVDIGPERTAWVIRFEGTRSGLKVSYLEVMTR